MSQATRPNDRHIIWSNQNLDVDDWREDYKEFLEANELDDDPNDEQALYEWMEETNYDYLSDERVNLNVQLSQPIMRRRSAAASALASCCRLNCSTACSGGRIV